MCIAPKEITQVKSFSDIAPLNQFLAKSSVEYVDIKPDGEYYLLIFKIFV
jgi:hypothetical protein